jgi:transposase-like protein
MPQGKKFTAERIIGKLREAEVGLAQGKTVPEVVRKLGVTEQTYYRWKREYGGLRPNRAITSAAVGPPATLIAPLLRPASAAFNRSMSRARASAGHSRVVSTIALMSSADGRIMACLPPMIINRHAGRGQRN